MNLIATIDQYDENFIYLCDPIRNNLMNGGHFYRFLYSSNEMTMNGVYIQVSFTDVCIDKFFAKTKFTFSLTSDLNKHVVDQIVSLEQSLLSKYKSETRKTCKFVLSDQFSSGTIKIHDDTPVTKDVSLLLKISGIWETDTEYGLTFKCLRV